MKTYSKIIRSLLTIGLLVVSSSSIAIPTLKFGGNISYSTNILSPADLNISGVLIPGYTDLSISPDLATSSVILSADFMSSSSADGYTTGLFGTTPANDLLISDNFGLNTLLTGNIDSLLLTGREGTNLGILAGTLEITGGLLAGNFGGTGSLFAINFNLDTIFAPDMFYTYFSGELMVRLLVPVFQNQPFWAAGFCSSGIIWTRRFYKRG